MATSPSGSTTRRALHAYVSDSAHSQWHDFAAENGVSVSALLEVLSHHLLPAGVDQEDTDDADGPDAGNGDIDSELAQMIVRARQLDAERRRRNRS